MSHPTSNLVPGGYVELLEIDLFAKSDDNTLNEDHDLSKLIRLLDEASTKIGRPFQDNKKNKDILRDTGFVDVVETVFKWPSNAWPKDTKHKEIGQWQNMNLDHFKGLEALSIAVLTRVLGWSQEEVTVFLAKVRKDVNNKAIHAYWPVYVVQTLFSSTLLTYAVTRHMVGSLLSEARYTLRGYRLERRFTSITPWGSVVGAFGDRSSRSIHRS